MAILQDVSKSNGKLSDKELIAQLQAENARLRERNSNRLSLKVSEKGAISCYGTGRFPITLYASQWTKVLAFADHIKAFMAENKDQLSVKD